MVVVTDICASGSCFCRKCNCRLCSGGLSVAVISIFLCLVVALTLAPVGAASLRRLPLYKQVCFQLAAFRVGSPLEPMKETDAVIGRLLAVLLWVQDQPGLEKAWRGPETCTSLTGSFKDGEILFNWWRSLLHSVIRNQFSLISARPKTPAFPLASLGGF